MGTGKPLANIASGSDVDRDTEEAGGIRFGAVLIVFSDDLLVDEDFEASASRWTHNPTGLEVKPSQTRTVTGLLRGAKRKVSKSVRRESEGYGW